MAKNCVLSQRIAHRFEIRDPEKDLLGWRSMSVVYRSPDTHSEETVIFKALAPRVVASDPGILERFVREGEALRQLNHPNMVRMATAVEEQGQHRGYPGRTKDPLQAGEVNHIYRTSF